MKNAKGFEYDFSGYATKNDLKCADGRTIRKDAFKGQDGAKVPLVYGHDHEDLDSVLGHAMLENREDGVYMYGKFNDTAKGQNAKKLVAHRDLDSLSIWANQLVEQSKNVVHGVIREVSLVLSGANPGALIDYLAFAHGDQTIVSDDEAFITTGLLIELPEIKHADTTPAADSTPAAPAKEKTVEDVVNSMNEEQKTVMYAIIAEAVDAASGDNVNHSTDEGDETVMKNNVFDGSTTASKERKHLTHDQFKAIVEDAEKCGSFKQAFLAHAVTYGIENIDYLFPDARTLSNTPDIVARRMEWVNVFLSGTRHTPFSRIKSMSADLTLDTARAKGYVKGALKKEEFFALSKRVTTPQTVYKKQKLDRDDIIDITDMDVVAWLKSEMRIMLDEEVARAGLISDGREADDEDKIVETNIRSIYKDDDFYSHKVQIAVADADDIEKIIETIIRARKEYKGSGRPVLFATTDFVTDMRLVKAVGDGRRLYANMAELEADLGVSKIVEVEPMDGVSRESGGKTWGLRGIMVALNDYTYGADKGGDVNFFDDFDIDYNQYKYLLETRLSGALTKPKSAMVIEVEEAAG